MQLKYLYFLIHRISELFASFFLFFFYFIIHFLFFCLLYLLVCCLLLVNGVACRANVCVLTVLCSAPSWLFIVD